MEFHGLQIGIVALLKGLLVLVQHLLGMAFTSQHTGLFTDSIAITDLVQVLFTSPDYVVKLNLTRFDVQQMHHSESNAQ
jgi:hypothetical protein